MIEPPPGYHGEFDIDHATDCLTGEEMRCVRRDVLIESRVAARGGPEQHEPPDRGRVLQRDSNHHRDTVRPGDERRRLVQVRGDAFSCVDPRHWSRVPVTGVDTETEAFERVEDSWPHPEPIRVHVLG